jgi:PAS domain-containing protein
MQAWAEAPERKRLDADIRLRRASDGAWRWHQKRAVRIGGPDGEWLGTCTDIEDQMQARAVLGVTARFAQN